MLRELCCCWLVVMWLNLYLTSPVTQANNSSITTTAEELFELLSQSKHHHERVAGQDIIRRFMGNVICDV